MAYDRRAKPNASARSIPFVEHFPYLLGEIGAAEGLQQQARARIQPAMMHDHVFGVAGHVEHLQPWRDLVSRFGHLATVHAAGEDDVAEQQVKVPLRFKLRTGGRTIGHCRYVVTERRQCGGCVLANLRVVLNHQDAFGSPPQRLHVFGLAGGNVLSAGTGQVELDRRPPPGSL